jgi:hypothetical protein
MNVAGSQTNVGAMHTLVTWHRNHAKRDNVDASRLRPTKAMQIDSCAHNIPTFILPHCTNLPYMQYIVPLGHNLATFKLPYPGTKGCPRAYLGMP